MSEAATADDGRRHRNHRRDHWHRAPVPLCPAAPLRTRLTHPLSRPSPPPSRVSLFARPPSLDIPRLCCFSLPALDLLASETSDYIGTPRPPAAPVSLLPPPPPPDRMSSTRPSVPPASHFHRSITPPTSSNCLAYLACLPASCSQTLIHRSAKLLLLPLAHSCTHSYRCPHYTYSLLPFTPPTRRRSVNSQGQL